MKLVHVQAQRASGAAIIMRRKIRKASSRYVCSHIIMHLCMLHTVMHAAHTHTHTHTHTGLAGSNDIENAQMWGTVDEIKDFGESMVRCHFEKDETKKV